MYTYTYPHMHNYVKDETLLQLVIESPEKSGPNWEDLLIQTHSSLSGCLVAEECRIDIYILRLSSHPVNDSVITTCMPRMINRQTLTRQRVYMYIHMYMCNTVTRADLSVDAWFSKIYAPGTKPYWILVISPQRVHALAGVCTHCPRAGVYTSRA